MRYTILMFLCAVMNIATDDASYMIAAAIWGLGAVFANGFKIRR